jgi:hypothetical protein
MMGWRGREKGPREHPIVCRKCRRMAGSKYKSAQAKRALRRRNRRVSKQGQWKKGIG